MENRRAYCSWWSNHRACRKNRLMAAGIPAGPGLRRTLEALLDAVVRGQLPNEQQCLLDAAGQISAS